MAHDIVWCDDKQWSVEDLNIGDSRVSFPFENLFDCLKLSCRVSACFTFYLIQPVNCCFQTDSSAFVQPNSTNCSGHIFTLENLILSPFSQLTASFSIKLLHLRISSCLIPSQKSSPSTPSWPSTWPSPSGRSSTGPRPRPLASPSPRRLLVLWNSTINIVASMLVTGIHTK